MTEINALALPDEVQFTTSIQAINRFQQVVHANMVKGLDYGIIPGTGNKPTLLKPGAEKIVKLLGLSDDYEMVDRQEDWSKGFFRYLIKCRLATVSCGTFVAAGLGECNSMESKYRWRWVFASQLPTNLQGEAGKPDRDKLVSREISTRNGKAKQYRMDNDDIYSQVNTLLKMAKKRALVDAALSAGRLSDVFTQDMDDLISVADEPDWDAIKESSTPTDKPPAARAAAKPTEAVRADTPAQDSDSTASRDGSLITDWGKLCAACKEDFKMSREAVLKKCGVSAFTQLSGVDEQSPSACYIAIKAAMG